MTKENWTDIHKDFGEKKYYWINKTYQQEWEEEGLTYQDAHEWISVGFKLDNYEQIKHWKNQNLTPQEAKSWIEKDLNTYDYKFASYLKQKNIQPHNLPKTIEELRGEYTKKYLNINYPNKPKTKEIKIGNYYSREILHGSLAISDYPNLEEIVISFQNNLTNLQVNNCPNLRELRVSNCQLTKLDLTQLTSLKKLYCSNNQLTEIKFPYAAREKLEILNLSKNNFNQDLSFLSGLVNLKSLDLGNNYFYGSLEFLKSLSELKGLDISHTDIDSGLEYLQDSLKEFNCSVYKRKDAKVKVIYDLFANEQGEVETDSNGIINFPQKLRFFKNKDWTSGNQTIDEFINKWQLKGTGLGWISYEQLTDIEYLTQGGFGKVYKAKWSNKDSNKKLVALKSLNDSVDIKEDFLQEITYHELLSFNNKSSRIVNCLGISREPKTKNYLMVMDYIKDGDLRKFLKNNQLDFKSKLDQLWRIAGGLRQIHERKLTHRDFHSGNILNKKNSNKDVQCYITDLGLCRPVNQKDKGDIYGVLPYVAPEVSWGKPYTQASDVYSFGIIAWEIFSGLPPYHNIAHDVHLSLKIHSGLRPNSDELKMPQLLKDLIQKCWDADSDKRPTAHELERNFKIWRKEINDKKDTEFVQQFREVEIEKINKSSCQNHPQAIYTSRLLDTNLLRSLSEPQNSEEINKQFYSLSSIDSYKPLCNQNNMTENSSELDLDIHSNNDIENLISRTKRQLSIDSQIKTDQRETKLTKIDEEREYHSEPTQIDYDWQSIHPNFTEKLQNQWKNHSFTYNQVQDWINIGLKPTDHQLAKFLKNQKNLTPEETLNHHNLNSLKAEFNQFQQIAQIVQPTTSTFPRNN